MEICCSRLKEIRPHPSMLLLEIKDKLLTFAINLLILDASVLHYFHIGSHDLARVP